MSQRLYSVYDVRSKQYGIPFVQMNDDLAKRTTAMTLLQVPPTHLMYCFASDFELCYLGELTDDGVLVSAGTGRKGLCFLNDIIHEYKIEKIREEKLKNEIHEQIEPADRVTE